MDYSHIEKPDLGYRYEFSIDELDAMNECVEAHGFAIIKNVLTEELVEDLRKSRSGGARSGRHAGRGQQLYPHRLRRAFPPPPGNCSTMSRSLRVNRFYCGDGGVDHSPLRRHHPQSPAPIRLGGTQTGMDLPRVLRKTREMCSISLACPPGSGSTSPAPSPSTAASPSSRIRTG